MIIFFFLILFFGSNVNAIDIDNSDVNSTLTIIPENNISSYNDRAYFDVTSLTITDKTLSDNLNQTINLTDYFWTINEGASLSYTISSSNSNLSDQITLSGATLSLNAQ